MCFHHHLLERNRWLNLVPTVNGQHRTDLHAARPFPTGGEAGAQTRQLRVGELLSSK